MGRLAVTEERKSRSWRWLWWLLGVVLTLALAAAGAVAWWYFRPAEKIQGAIAATPFAWVDDAGRTHLAMRNGNLVALTGEYQNELTAYLRFEYLQGMAGLAGRETLMTSSEANGGPVYRLYAVMQNDVLAAGETLGSLSAQRYLGGFVLESPPTVTLNEWRKQTQLFYAAYHQPMQQKLLQLPPEALQTAVARFILFKVRTDKRVRTQIAPQDKVLSPEESLDFAADMIQVAHFYDLPLELLLGISAMENNYLDIQGDLQHSIWKRRAQTGDIVLKRRKGRVLVSNYSQGPWQITRETLRYAHALYLKDKDHDYSKLPERLRPPKTLDLDKVDSHVLTTYAGLLLRHLLDYFDGDITKAQGAYNGGAGKPNLKYAEGVQTVADYAKRMLSMAAGRKGNSVQETPMQVEPARPEPIPQSLQQPTASSMPGAFGSPLKPQEATASDAPQ